MYAKKTAFCISVLFFALLVHAQKPERGSAADRAWEEDLRKEFPLYHDSTTKYRGNNTAILEFGNWSVRANYTDYTRYVSKQVNDNPKIVPRLLGGTTAVKDSVTYYNTIFFRGSDPGKNKFSGRFSYIDSFYLNYEQQGLLGKIQNSRMRVFMRSATGYVQTSTGDTARFFMQVFYDHPNLEATRPSYLQVGKNNFTLNPFWGINEKRLDPERNHYEGYDIVLNEKLVAGALIRKGFMGIPVYKFWISKDLDTDNRQAIAAVIFVIVEFF